jgi:hypothetical protein
MERGVVVGGLLISGSFLLAVLLNQSAKGPEGPVTPIQIVAPVAAPNTVLAPNPRLADCCTGTDKECLPARDAPPAPCEAPKPPSPGDDTRR